MFKKILLGFLVVIVVLVIVIALQPDDFRVARSAKMSAPPEVVFAQVNDFHNWQAWSPWAKLDPNAQATFEGPESGEGAIFRWSGESKTVGEGSMKILESKPNEFVKIELEFVRPVPGTSTVEFAFKPEGDETNVSWTMYGKNNFLGKAIGLVMNCDKMMGEFFEQGLASIKSIVEAKPQN